MLRIILIVVVSFLFLFQGFHFLEHGIQLGAWIGGFNNMPYMTPWATEIVWRLGEWLVPGEEDYHRIFKLGVEYLHLVGNILFLIGIGGLWILNRSRYVKYAFWFQVIHVFEHVMLFASTYYVHQSIGMSTLFGYFQPYGTDVYDQVALTTFRVWWHFIANLIPSVLILFCAKKLFKK